MDDWKAPVMGKKSKKNLGMEREAFINELIDLIEQNSMAKKASDRDTYKEWLVRWLSQPIPALAGEIPNDIIGDNQGRDRVKTMLGRAIFSTYS